MDGWWWCWCLNAARLGAAPLVISIGATVLYCYRAMCMFLLLCILTSTLYRLTTLIRRPKIWIALKSETFVYQHDTTSRKSHIWSMTGCSQNSGISLKILCEITFSWCVQGAYETQMNFVFRLGFHPPGTLLYIGNYSKIWKNWHFGRGMFNLYCRFKKPFW